MKFNKANLSQILLPLLSILMAFFIGAIIILCIGKNPLEAYAFLFKGAFGSVASFAETLVKVTPLIFSGLAAVFAYRCGMFNLGAEGQMIMGAIAAVWFSVAFSYLPGWLNMTVSLLLGCIAGALWGIIPGILKAKGGVNEMIVSILLNYVATLFMSFLYSGPLKEAKIPQTAAVPDSARLAKFLGNTRAHIGIFLALAAAFLVYYFLFHTYKGYQLRAVGLNPIASRVNGFPINKYILMAFLVSGGIAGFGGAVQLLGSSMRLQSGFVEGFGFDGVAIALIGQLHPVGTVLVAYLFAVLRCGTNTMQINTGISTSVVNIIEGIIIIFAVASSALVQLPELQQRLNSRRAARKECNYE